MAPEQGFGDYIQFVRDVPLLKARGVTRLTLGCSLPWSVLLAAAEGVDEPVTALRNHGGHHSLDVHAVPCIGLFFPNPHAFKKNGNLVEFTVIF
jgi:hypothetical protein